MLPDSRALPNHAARPDLGGRVHVGGRGDANARSRRNADVSHALPFSIQNNSSKDTANTMPFAIVPVRMARPGLEPRAAGGAGLWGAHDGCRPCSGRCTEAAADHAAPNHDASQPCRTGTAIARSGAALAGGCCRLRRHTGRGGGADRQSNHLCHHSSVGGVVRAVRSGVGGPVLLAALGCYTKAGMIARDTQRLIGRAVIMLVALFAVVSAVLEKEVALTTVVVAPLVYAISIATRRAVTRDSDTCGEPVSRCDGWSPSVQVRRSPSWSTSLHGSPTTRWWSSGRARRGAISSRTSRPAEIRSNPASDVEGLRGVMVDTVLAARPTAGCRHGLRRRCIPLLR